ncbi:unnamed protein product [Trifolium pratense]|uniref:Uncharacterized protein n=1 Tax=Trifolium pratense TaxID=57577 RepID=A0ACB0JXC3_TRIPR|nr:unnamed protein product [Trifolium pratense]
MAEMLKKIYAMTLFLFLFFVATKVIGDDFIICKFDADCPKSSNEFLLIKCIDHICRYVGNLPDSMYQTQESTKIPYERE